MFGKLHDSKLRRLYVPVTFMLLCIAGIIGANVSPAFLGRELTFRFIANGITVFSLLIPLYAGMGLNFSLVLGAIASQAAVILTVDRMVTGPAGIMLSVILSVAMSILFGNVIGALLNRAKGKEMITSIVIGFVGSSLYQLVFMVLYGRVIIPANKDILLSSGIGVRNLVDIYSYKLLIDKVQALPVIVTLLCAIFVVYLMRTRFGNKIKAVGQNMDFAEMQGIDVNRVRRMAIVISTVLSSLGHLLYMYSMGNVNVYSGHLNIDVFACAALLAGGATLSRASILNALAGIFLFHTLFIVSPLAAKNYFSNIAIGEYFRSFIAYGVIVLAFVINVRNKEGTVV
jgi:simple sugar transport system permease protein